MEVSLFRPSTSLTTPIYVPPHWVKSCTPFYTKKKHAKVQPVVIEKLPPTDPLEKKRIEEDTRFQGKFCKALEDVKKRPTPKKVDRLKKVILGYLNSPLLITKEFAEKWIAEQLNDLPFETRQILYRDTPSLKRSVQQYVLPPVFSSPQPLLPSNLTSGVSFRGDAYSLCGSVDQFAYGVATNTSQQYVMLYNLNGGVFQWLQSESLNISSLLGPTSGINYFNSGCYNRTYQFTTTSGGGTQRLTHFTVTDGQLTQPPYVAFSGNATDPMPALPPGAIPGGQAALAPMFGLEYHYTETTSGKFQGPGPVINTDGASAATEQPDQQTVTTFLDSTKRITQSRNNPVGVFEYFVNASGVVGAPRQIYSGASLYKLQATKTTLQTGQKTGTEVSLNGIYNSTFVVLNRDYVNGILTPVVNTTELFMDSASKANCGPDYPDIDVVVRGTLLGDWYMKYNAFNSSNFGLSLYQTGEQTLPIPSLVNISTVNNGPQAQITCLSGGTVVITYSDNGNRMFIHGKLFPTPPSSSTPSTPAQTPTIAPTPTSSIILPTAVWNGTSLLNLNQTYRPITGQDISFNATWFILDDPKGLGLVNSVTCIPISKGIPFPALQILNTSIALGNATVGAVPTLRACNNDFTICKNSTALAEPEPVTALNLGDDFPYWILGTGLGVAFGVAIIVVSLFAKFVWCKDRKLNEAKDANRWVPKPQPQQPQVNAYDPTMGAAPKRNTVAIQGHLAKAKEYQTYNGAQ